MLIVKQLKEYNRHQRQFFNFNSYIFGGENKLLIRFAKEFIKVYKYFKQNEDSLIMIMSVSTKNDPISNGP